MSACEKRRIIGRLNVCETLDHRTGSCSIDCSLSKAKDHSLGRVVEVECEEAVLEI